MRNKSLQSGYAMIIVVVLIAVTLMLSSALLNMSTSQVSVNKEIEKNNTYFYVTESAYNSTIERIKVAVNEEYNHLYDVRVSDYYNGTGHYLGEYANFYTDIYSSINATQPIEQTVEDEKISTSIIYPTLGELGITNTTDVGTLVFEIVSKLEDGTEIERQKGQITINKYDIPKVEVQVQDSTAGAVFVATEKFKVKNRINVVIKNGDVRITPGSEFKLVGNATLKDVNGNDIAVQAFKVDDFGWKLDSTGAIDKFDDYLGGHTLKEIEDIFDNNELSGFAISSKYYKKITDISGTARYFYLDSGPGNGSGSKLFTFRPNKKLKISDSMLWVDGGLSLYRQTSVTNSVILCRKGAFTTNGKNGEPISFANSAVFADEGKITLKNNSNFTNCLIYSIGDLEINFKDYTGSITNCVFYSDKKIKITEIPNNITMSAQFISNGASTGGPKRGIEIEKIKGKGVINFEYNSNIYSNIFKKGFAGSKLYDKPDVVLVEIMPEYPSEVIYENERFIMTK